MACIASLSSFSSLSLRQSLPSTTPSFTPPLSLKLKPKTLRFPLLLTNTSSSIPPESEPESETELGPYPNDIYFYPTDPIFEDQPFDPPTPPEGYEPPIPFYELPPETEEELTIAYEERYGPVYSGVSLLGNDIMHMDVGKVKNPFNRKLKPKRRDGFLEKVVETRRVVKVLKGGKVMSYRVMAIIGDMKGLVGVGVGKSKEASDAIYNACTDARKNVVEVPLNKYGSFPHRAEAKFGAAKVMLRPAADGTGVLAGGAVRTVLQMAGVENCLAKQLGSKNLLNNARATLLAILQMRTFREVAEWRGIPMEELWK